MAPTNLAPAAADTPAAWRYIRLRHQNKQHAHYDVAIVGAGPAGAVAGYYLARGGAKALLLERAKFPRDKHCGDAVCKTAIEILQDMGILGQLIAENKALPADAGGLVSPSGISFIGRSAKYMGGIPAALACKRVLLDEAVARAAQRAGADLKEEHAVQVQPTRNAASPHPV